MKTTRRLFAAAMAFLFAALAAFADEGMWLPVLIQQRIEDMQAKGLNLEAEDIYSVEKASLKDAVVLFGSGCTGEVVSADGLLLTNHHCGYSMIQSHSSVEHDYLRDGFWAMTRDQELPNPGLTVSFLERMEDVTARIAKGETAASIREEAIKDGKGLRASVEPLYYGNKYYLFVYKVYRDVRLVGAPPSSIGKFGGDTDNWMWPRHTGDFSIFRIYADANGDPADYSKDNVPYHPKKFFTISRKGVNEGDFTFIYGCPGSTQEYVGSEMVRYTQEVLDPARIDIRTKRLNIIKHYMGESQKVRIQYSSKQASVANAWKKWQGEELGLRRNDIVDRKIEFEKDFADIAGKVNAACKEWEKYDFAKNIYRETAATVELPSYALNYANRKGKKAKKSYKEYFEKNYYMPIDKECFVEVMTQFGKLMPAEMVPEYYTSQLQRYGTVQAWADALFASNPTKKDNDLKEFASSMQEWYNTEIGPKESDAKEKMNALQKTYMAEQMKKGGESIYPDANLTLRVAYGKVQGYAPADGVYYNHVSTLKGVMEKDDPDIFDYNIPQVLRDIYARGGMEDVPVCFIATNHTTGGNSGSPVINGDGQLIGINFDRVWEGTMSDLAFDPDFCRNISLDIRYLLFVVENVGGAKHLLEEMSFAD